MIVPGCEALLGGPFGLLGESLKPLQEDDDGHQQTRLKPHEHAEGQHRGQGQVTVPVLAGVQHLLLCQVRHQPASHTGGGAAVDPRVGRDEEGGTPQQGPQVEDAAVAHPGVPVQRDVAQGAQVVQEPVGEGGQQIVVQEDVGGPCGEGGGHRGGGERPAAAVHLAACTGAGVGARPRPLTSADEEQTQEEKLRHGGTAAERGGHRIKCGGETHRKAPGRKQT